MYTKNKQKHIDSKMFFIESAFWKKGHTIIRVAVENDDGTLSPVGSIHLDGYNENEKGVFSSCNLEGKELFETTVNLYQLKRQFRDSEIELTQAMRVHEAGRLSRAEQMPERSEEKISDVQHETNKEDSEHSDTIAAEPEKGLYVTKNRKEKPREKSADRKDRNIER